MGANHTEVFLKPVLRTLRKSSVVGISATEDTEGIV